MAIRAGVPVQDMEMCSSTRPVLPVRAYWSPKVAVGRRLSAEQTWRTLYGALCAEAKDLAGRDVVARSIMIEIREVAAVMVRGGHMRN